MQVAAILKRTQKVLRVLLATAARPKRFYCTSEESTTNSIGELTVELEQTPTVAVMERVPSMEGERRQAELEYSQQESNSKNSGEFDDSKFYSLSCSSSIVWWV